MAGCGYVCPVCEGRGFLDTGADCNFCTPAAPPTAISRDEWIARVHEGPCCADVSENEKPQNT